MRTGRQELSKGDRARHTADVGKAGRREVVRARLEELHASEKVSRAEVRSLRVRREIQRLADRRRHCVVIDFAPALRQTLFASMCGLEVT